MMIIIIIMYRLPDSALEIWYLSFGTRNLAMEIYGDPVLEILSYSVV